MRFATSRNSVLRLGDGSNSSGSCSAPNAASVGFLRALAGFLCTAAGGVRVVEFDFTLGDACCNFVQLRIKNADALEIADFKCLQLGAKLRDVGFAVGKGGADGGKALTLFGEMRGVGIGLEDDFGWHRGCGLAGFSLNRAGNLPGLGVG